MVGGYTEIHQDQLASIRSEQSFIKSEEAARKKFADEHHENLGQLVKVYQQVVAGMNYKMVFETASGQVEIDVFSQPWTETYDVTAIQKVIEGVWLVDSIHFSFYSFFYFIGLNLHRINGFYQV